MKLSRLQQASIAVAIRYRPKGFKPLALVIQYLSYRWNKETWRLAKGNYTLDLKVSALTEKIHLTSKQIRDALETLRAEKLISYDGQGRAKRDGKFIRGRYDIRPMMEELDRLMKPSKYHQLGLRAQEEQDHRDYLEDLARDQIGGWGVARYSEEVKRQVEEELREARADLQFQEHVDNLERQRLLDMIMEVAPYMQALWIQHHQTPEEAQESLSEEYAEGLAAQRQEDLEYEAIYGPIFEMMGFPGWCNCLNCINDS